MQTERRSGRLSANAKAPADAGAFACLKGSGLLHDNAANRFLVGFLLVGLAGAHGFFAPLVSLREVGLARRVIAAVEVGLAAMRQHDLEPVSLH